ARRENQRMISVRTNIRGRDQGSFVAEAQAKFEKTVKLPTGYRVTWGGQFENLQRARKRLTVILPITIGIIFALLFFAFGSAVEAIIQGSVAQMRPVLMMVVVALLGMVPAARATGIGSDVQRPLATVVVGGLLSTLLLTLLVLPSLYYLTAGRRRADEIYSR